MTMYCSPFRKELTITLILLLFGLLGNIYAQVAGNIQAPFEREGNIIRFSTQNADVRLEFCTPSVVRIRASWNREFSNTDTLMVIKDEWDPVEIDISRQEEYYEFETAQLWVRVGNNPFLVEFYSPEGRLLSTEELENGYGGLKKEGEAVSVLKKLLPDEHFFGFGERMDFVDQLGKKVRLNVGRGTGRPHIVGAYNILEANYSPVPFFMSTRGYGIFFRTSYATTWDMGHSQRDEYSFKAADGEVDYYFIYGPDFPSMLDRYTTLAGKSPLLPKFAHGLNVGTYSGGTWGYEEHTSDEYVVNLGRKFRETGIPADVLHLDSTWRIFGKRGHGSTTFEWRNTFDHPETMFDSLYAMGYDMVGLHVRPRYDNGIKYNLLDRAREAGVVYPEPNNSGEFVNFFDPEAIDWWWENGAMKVVSQGAMFFKTDEGSAFGHKANESDKTGPTGEEAEWLHNLFPIAYAKAPFERFSRHNRMRGFNLTREGYAGIQRYPYIWAGDWPSEWQYFEPVIRAGINIGLSGVGYWSHNMGGFEHRPDPELYIRWSQFGLMSPMAHLFGMDHPGYKEPWSYGEEAQRIFKKYDRMRYHLIPYIYSEAWRMHKTGVPIMRALVLEYQNDVNVYDIDNQYLFGGNMMICPVTTKGAQTRIVYLPEGTWFDYWTGERYSGKQYLNVVTPLEKLPIFVKAGSIIPQQQVLNLGQESPEILKLEIFPYAESSFTIYDDDGKSNDYLKDQFATTRVVAKADGDRITVTIAKPEGRYTVRERGYELKIHTVSSPRQVISGNNKLEQLASWTDYKPDQTGWHYNRKDKILHIRPPGTSRETITVTITR